MSAGLHRLRQLPFVAWIILYCATLWGVFGPILGAVTPNLRQQMGLSYDQIGWLMAIWANGSALGSIAGGVVAKRYAPVWLLRTYTVLVLCALLILITATGFWGMAVGLFCIAFFETAIFTVGHGLLAEISDEPSERTRIVGLVDVGFSIGTILSPLLVGLGLWLMPNWQMAYGLFTVLVLYLLWLTLQTQRMGQVRFKDHGEAVEAASGGYWVLLKHPVVLAVCVAGLFSGFVEAGQMFWFVSYATQALGYSEALARLMLGLVMAGMTVGRLWLVFGNSRWPMAAVLVGLSGLVAFALLGLWLLPAGTSWPVVAVLNVLAGLGVSVGFPVLMGSALQAAPSQAPRLSAMLMLSITCGFQTSALLLGYVAETAGLSWVYLGLSLGAMGLVGMAWRLFALLHRSPKPEAALS